MVKEFNLKRMHMTIWSDILDCLEEHGYSLTELQKVFDSQTKELSEESTKFVDFEEVLYAVKHMNIYFNLKINKQLEDHNHQQAKEINGHLEEFNMIFRNIK